MQTKPKIIQVAGFDVEVHHFSYAAFYYPAFNGNAEFPVTAKGFRALSSYLRTVKWLNKLIIWD
jgi:hypothetical protein